METQKFIELIVREQISFIQVILPKRKTLFTTGINDMEIYKTQGQLKFIFIYNHVHYSNRALTMGLKFYFHE